MTLSEKLRSMSTREAYYKDALLDLLTRPWLIQYDKDMIQRWLDKEADRLDEFSLYGLAMQVEIEHLLY